MISNASARRALGILNKAMARIDQHVETIKGLRALLKEKDATIAAMQKTIDEQERMIDYHQEVGGHI